MKKMLFIMNPYAGQRRANRYLTDILTIFNRAGYDVTVYMTAGPGDGAKVVEERAAQMDLIACWCGCSFGIYPGRLHQRFCDQFEVAVQCAGGGKSHRGRGAAPLRCRPVR